MDLGAGDLPGIDPASVLAQISDHAIVALDAAGTIQSWNTGAERLIGYRAADAIGRSVTISYADEDCLQGVPLGLLDAARRDGRAERQGWRVRQDGTPLWADTVVSVLRAGDGGGDHDAVIGFVEVTRDISARKEIEDAQTSFLASIAHDFRTPITAMKGFTELVRDAPADQRDDFLRRIDANADRLTQMMKDLLSYGTVPEVGDESRAESFDLAALARNTVLAMGSQAELARVVLPSGTAHVCVDRTSMERIITNLVDNALKYSDDGPVSVDVSSGEDRVRLSVSDEGRGIDQDDLAVIFDEFERGRLATSDGGTGLGLASVKRLAEEQGGRVLIQSVLGQGTVVTVELPPPAERVEPAVATA